MRTFDLIAMLVVMAAVFSYVNLKVLKLPSAIGLMALTLLFSDGGIRSRIIHPGRRSSGR